MALISKNQVIAQTVDEIFDSLKTQLTTNFAAVGVTIDTNKWSKRNILRVLLYSVAVISAYVEQYIVGIYNTTEEVVAKGYSGSKGWLIERMLNFQYSATNPQYLQVIDGVLDYATTDDSLKIIKACAVSKPFPNVVYVKVAKNPSGSLVKLSTLEVAAAQDYVNQIGVTGITYKIQSTDPARLYVNADIYFEGQYSAVIQTNVEAAITDYLQNISVNQFDGSILVSELEDAIQSVAGVNDVVLKNVQGRENSTPYGSGTDLVLNSKTLLRKWNSLAGYSVPEDETGHTLADSLTYISE